MEHRMPDDTNLVAAVILTIVAWLTVIPLAGATIARAVTVERIFSALRDFIEIRWPRSLLHYVSTCPVCMSYWSTCACSLAAWWVTGWGFSPRCVVALVILTLAAIRPANILATWTPK